jgi:hypothetical protein
MENNYRKFFSSQNKNQNSSVMSRCFEKNEIVLGKRGRPSKSNSQTPNIIPEKMMGSYLNSMQSTRDSLRMNKQLSVPKPMYKGRSQRKTKMQLSPSESFLSTSMKISNSKMLMASKPLMKQIMSKPIQKRKEVKNKCPVYYDEMLMELIYINQKQSNQTPIFLIKRNSVFEQMEKRLICLKGNGLFFKKINVDVGPSSYIGSRAEFDILKAEKIMVKNGQRPRSRGDIHYNYGTFMENENQMPLGYQFGIQTNPLLKRSKSEISKSKTKKKRKYKARSKSPNPDLRDKTNHSFCEHCGKNFSSFFEFLHHVQTVHQKNVEEIV